ncbi:MAG: ATP synthase F1 subunit gamma [Myxococcales bacterium]|nr:ATP synthase F1 subunit gamma [Myxococcales bacterium]
MPNLKDIRTRIGTVKKTKQITSAMKLVAGAKLKRATERALAARPYREQLEAVLKRVGAAAGDDLEEPLLQSRETVKRIMVVTLTSDRGLCGPFNNALMRKVNPWLKERAADGAEPVVHIYGRKGMNALKRSGFEPAEAVVDYGRTSKMDLVRPLTSAMVAAFIDGDVDEVYIVYNRFKSALVQTPTFERVLPLSVQATEGEEDEGEAHDAETATDYRYEPAAGELLGALLPLYLQTLVLGAFLETEAGEFAARMTAMDSATRNAGDLIDQLSLDYNRARQAAITTEIIEIVSGAAAL